MTLHAPGPDVDLHPTPDGSTIAVRALPGTGNPLVVLHGFTGDGTTMLELSEAARGGRPALLVDLIGHGGSDAPDNVEPYSMASVVDQVLSVIGFREPGTVHLVGYSMGGRVALSMAARAPWFFGSVTSISATGGIDAPMERADRLRADEALADRLCEIGVEAFITEWLRLPLFAPLIERLSDEQLRLTHLQRCRASSLGLANSLRGTGAGAMPPVWDRLAGLRSPLLALAGARDPKYVQLAERLASTAPDGRSVSFDGLGHALPLENPLIVAPPLRDFLEECERSTR